ncbi:MAG: nitrous oxide-stimulated promoter family protein [Planctomycetota bacterium]
MDKKQKDKLLLEKFIGVYCGKKHGTDGTLCAECTGLRDYAFEKLDTCPLDPKPKCKDCRVHCYGEPRRSQIKEVMKFSGIHFVKRGRLD